MEKDTIGIAKSVPRDVSHEETSTASLPPHKTDSRRILIPSPSSDPHDPLNWPLKKKLALLFTLCFCTWAATLAPPVGQLAYYRQTELYDRSPTELSYAISAAVAGLLAGPLIFVPLTAVVGSNSVIFWNLVGVLACQIWAASMTGSGDYNAFIISRLFAGLFAGSTTILGSGTIIDIFFLHQRGRAFASYELSLLFGVLCGPTIGGFIVQDNSWTVAFWWTLAPVGAAIILLVIFGEETKFERESESRGRHSLPSGFIQSRISIFFPGTQVTGPSRFTEMIERFKKPFILCLSPVIVIAGMYTFVAFGFTILLAIVSAIYLQTPIQHGGYGFTPYRNAAFTFVSWITVVVAQFISLLMSDRLPLWVAERWNKGVWRPEYRVWNMWFSLIISPVGLAIVAVTLEYHLHYMVLALGTFLVNTAAQLAVPLLINYVVECFTAHAIEVSVVMNCYRLAFGLALAFFVEPWEEVVGKGWVFGMASLFVFGAGVLVMVLAWKGESLRHITPARNLLSSEQGKRVVLIPHDCRETGEISAE